MQPMQRQMKLQVAGNGNISILSISIDMNMMVEILNSCTHPPTTRDAAGLLDPHLIEMGNE